VPHQPCVYILARARNGTLYVGVTSNLRRRVWQHKHHFFPRAFTAKYGVGRLVWYEVHAEIRAAIKREKAIKKWRRAWKIELIEKKNPYWRDLSAEL
jgi:putative endonuclease